MKITNIFMHEGRVLRPGDAIPDGVDERTVQAWMRNNLVGGSYAGPTRRPLPAPTETKPAAPARKPQAIAKQSKSPAEPKPAETKTATENAAPIADTSSTSDTNQSENVLQQSQAATDAVADPANPAASSADQV